MTEIKNKFMYSLLGMIGGVTGIFALARCSQTGCSGCLGCSVVGGTTLLLVIAKKIFGKKEESDGDI